jgi:GAF domain-containing protein
MIEAGQTLHVPAFPLGEGLSSEVIHTRQPLLLSTAEEVQKHSLEIGARQIGDPAQSWLGVPILYGGEPLGLIIVQDTQRDGRFKPEDAQLLTTLASQVAVVIRNVRLLETSRRQMRQERLVNEINARIRRAVDVHSILKTTADELGLALGARRAAIHIRPPEMAAGTAAAPAPPSEAEPPPHAAGPHASPTGEEPA